MKDFLAEADRARFERHGLADFAALWQLELAPVDAPNTERGGVSCVYRLELEGAAYYLKRQSNHLARSCWRPLGEPTFAREFRAIRRYAALGIPALQAAFYGERRVPGEHRAILVTRALDGWRDLEGWLQTWDTLPEGQRERVVRAVGDLARRLHGAGQVHGCFYPKHIFLRTRGEAVEACLIDLEKSRRLCLGQHDRVRDLEPLLRRAAAWRAQDVTALLDSYLAGASSPRLTERLLERRRRKEASA